MNNDDGRYKRPYTKNGALKSFEGKDITQAHIEHPKIRIINGTQIRILYELDLGSLIKRRILPIS